MEKSLELYLLFKDEDSKQALSILNEVGATDVEQVPQLGLTGVEIVVLGILAAQALANLIIRLLPLWKCGVVVDARGSRVSTTKDCNIPQGSVLVISKTGIQTKLDKPSGFQIDSLIKKAISESS